MSGNEIQEPFNLSFQANSIHSGSISFGRFEKEGLSWEKRSSFSHNKYLEEVDKFSKPGSVTQMKAHFEAHFKKKGIRFPASIESQTWGVRQTGDDNGDGDAVYATESFEDYRSDESFSENTSQSDSPCNYSHEQEKYDEERDLCVSYDEIVVNSDDVIELDEEGGVDHGTLAVSLDNDEVCITVKEDSCEESSKEDLGLPEVPLEIEVRDGNEDCATRLDQDAIHTKSYDVTERPKSLESSTHAVSVTKDFTKRHDVTPKAASKRTNGSVTSNSKTKSQKETRPKKTVESQPPISKKAETRTPLATNRCKSGTYSAKLELSTSATGFRFKSSERAEKRKEFYMKLEEKIHAKKTETNQVQAKTQQKAEAEMKQFRKSLNFKAKPMPSFYNTGTRPVSHNKNEISKVTPSRPRPTTSASITNRLVTRVGYKQSAVKDSDLQKGNLLTVKTKQKVGTRKNGE